MTTEPWITHISIKNFRSIVKADISCGQITTFIGKNNAGKSNILKALNLFFNGETELGEEYNFEKDFCKFAQTPKKKASEVIITITFRLPSSFKSDVAIWQKVWRGHGLFTPRGYIRDGKDRDFNRISKVPYWLENINFTYVPAIKDKYFFSRIQGEMYKTMEQSAEGSLRKSAESFEKTIRKKMMRLLASIQMELRNESGINLPEDLSRIFEDLEFQNNGFPLSRSGDGIKIRHIPEILHFIGDERNEDRKSGGVGYTDIWGFEEPENCVEMGAGFDLLITFIKYAAEGYQTFFTTHSPIFYKIEEEEFTCENYLVREKIDTDGKKKSIITLVDDDTKLDEHMGLLPIVTPFIKETKQNWEEATQNWKEEKQKRKQLEKEIQRLKEKLDTRLPHLFLEGKSDKIIFICALDIFYPDKNYTSKINIYPEEGEHGGAENVKNKVIGWHSLTKNRKNGRVKAVAVFDDDNVGRPAYDEAFNSLSNNGKEQIKLLKLIKKLPTPANCERSIVLESLYDDDTWISAKKEGKITKKKGFDGSGLDLSEADELRVSHDWIGDEKAKTAKHIAEICEKDRSEGEKILAEFKPIVDEIIKHLFPK